MKNIIRTIFTLLIIAIIYSGIVLLDYSYQAVNDYPTSSFTLLFGMIFSVGGFIWLVTHLFAIIHVGYHYRATFAKRNAIQNTLYDLKSHNKDGGAMITKDVMKFNTYLALRKVNLKSFYHGQYIDDRTEFIEPIS